MHATPTSIHPPPNQSNNYYQSPNHTQSTHPPQPPTNNQVRTLSETVRLDARTKLLNPKFYEGMLSTGYEGAREITKRLRNTMVRGFCGVYYVYGIWSCNDDADKRRRSSLPSHIP